MTAPQRRTQLGAADSAELINVQVGVREPDSLTVERDDDGVDFTISAGYDFASLRLTRQEAIAVAHAIMNGLSD